MTDIDFHCEDVSYENVDIIILEGIFLQKALKEKYDLRIWIECSFDVALERALKRGQEQFAEEDTIRSYETIYSPRKKSTLTWIILAIEVILHSSTTGSYPSGLACFFLLNKCTRCN